MNVIQFLEKEGILYRLQLGNNNPQWICSFQEDIPWDEKIIAVLEKVEIDAKLL